MKAGSPPTHLESVRSPALAAIERERFRTYSALVRNLHWLAAALVVLFAILHPSVPRVPLYLLAAIVVGYTLALHSPLLAHVPRNLRIGIETVLDLGWVTAVIVSSGAGNSPFFFLFYPVLFASTSDRGRGLAYAKAGAATLLSVAAVAWPAGLGSFEHLGHSLFDELLWPLASLWLVAYFAAESANLGASLHRSLFLAAHTDELTGLPNLRSFTLLSDLRNRLGQPYAIVMVDADYLKRTNDTFGHAKGSELLQRIAEALRHSARSGDDLCSRVGGDEFIVRLAGASSNGATAYCERVRHYLAKHPLALPDSGELPVSVSMGAAVFPDDGRNLSEVTEHADRALYASKRMRP